MTIDFTVKDYFAQLDLMEMQYEQEEDLYPWIYMLLQRAECKKKEKLKTEYSEVSIRDVHGANSISINAVRDNPFDTEEKNSAYWKLRFDITKRVGPPDIVIIGNSMEVLACVEVKQLNQKLFTEPCSSLSMKLPEKFSYVLGYFRKPKVEIFSQDIEQFNEVIKKIMNEHEGISAESNKCDFNFTITSQDEVVLESVLEEICKAIPRLVVKNKGKGIWKYNTKNLSAGKESNQLAGHLDKFKKVLFTNGLQFYYLERGKWDSTQRTYGIQCIKLEDLSGEYSKYLASEDKDNFDSTEADKLWDQLLELLTVIKWENQTNIKELASKKDSFKSIHS